MQEDNDNLKNILKVSKNVDSDEKIKECVNDLLKICDNPYKLWKYFTEIKGIMYF